MKILVELPDKTTCLGLFVNVHCSPDGILSTNWLTKAEDGKIIRVAEDCKITEDNTENYQGVVGYICSR